MCARSHANSLTHGAQVIASSPSVTRRVPYTYRTVMRTSMFGPYRPFAKTLGKGGAHVARGVCYAHARRHCVRCNLVTWPPHEITGDRVACSREMQSRDLAACLVRILHVATRSREIAWPALGRYNLVTLQPHEITGDRAACPREMQSRETVVSRDHGRSRGLPSGDAIS